MTSAQLRRVVATVFGAKESDITETTSPDNLPAWDSLQHLTLIVALEQEFGVTVGPEEGAELLSVGIIQLFLEERGALVPPS